MFFAIIFIAIGVAVLLNAMGLFTGSFWGIFWGVIFIAIGVKMLTKDGASCCNWGSWKDKFKEMTHAHDKKADKK